MSMQELTPSQSLGISAAGGLLSAGGNIISTLLTNRANRKLAEYSFDQQKQLIHEQNEYNSPYQQMSRYKEAGLNPNLMFGNVENGNQSQLAKYDAPTMQAPNVDADITGALQLMLSAKRTEAEINNIHAQTERYKEETRSAMLRNNMESYLMGKPVEGWDLVGSRALQKYDLGLQSQHIINTMNSVRTEVDKLNSKEKAFFIETLLPLTLKLKQLEIEGVSYDNAMKAIDTTLWRDKRIAEMSSSPFRIIGRIADEFIPKQSPAGSAVKTMINQSFKPFGMFTEGWKHFRSKFRK